MKIVVDKDKATSAELPKDADASDERRRCNIKKEKSVEEIKTADADLFKSTITAFDILSERCSELLGLFDNDNENEAVELSVNSLMSLNRYFTFADFFNKD